MGISEVIGCFDVSHLSCLFFALHGLSCTLSDVTIYTYELYSKHTDLTPQETVAFQLKF